MKHYALTCDREGPEMGLSLQRHNGKDLDGWLVDGGDEKNFRVQDGVLVAAGASWEARSYLLSNRDDKNFRLRLQYKVDASIASKRSCGSNGRTRIPSGSTLFRSFVQVPVG